MIWTILANVVIRDRESRSCHSSKRGSMIWTTGKRGDHEQSAEVPLLVEAMVDDLDYW